ncbi:MAG: beta-eliminating lyase-related protein [Thiobacillaceae bacterium]
MKTAKIASELTDREQHLEACGYNVVNIHPSLVDSDLMTDSWTELVSQEIADRMQSLREQVDYSDRATHAAALFPFKHFINVSQGRAAEAYFWRAAGKKDKQVVQNLLFPTTRHHLVLNRMEPVELPVRHVFNRDSDDLFRGNLDCEQLKTLLAGSDAEKIAYIYIEAENNASGGYPVSMANVREIRELIAGHTIQMVLDATRLIENAVLIQRFEAGYSNTSVREIVREFCSYFDSMTCSLAKDFGITRGGLMGTNDERMFYRLKDVVATFGPGINATDKAMINAAMKDMAFIEQAVKRRVDQAARLHAALVKSGLPLATPASGHCVVLNVADYMDASNYTNATVAFTAWVYEQSGVRGGMHVTGMMKEYAQVGLVRFAIPLCVPDEKIDALIDPFIKSLKEIGRIPDMQKTSNMPGMFGMMHATYKPV